MEMEESVAMRNTVHIIIFTQCMTHILIISEDFGDVHIHGVMVK